MTLTQQMGIKLVHVATLLAANVAFPRIRVRMTSLVQKIQSLIGKADPAKNALQTTQRSFTRTPPRRGIGRLLRTGGSYRSVRRGGPFVRRTLRILVGRRH